MLRKVRGRRRVARCRGIALCLTGLMLLLLTGCVEQTLGPDRNAYLGSQIAIVSTCTPEDPGIDNPFDPIAYKYTWVCKQKPPGSSIPGKFP